MSEKISKKILRMIGWQITNDVPNLPQKYIVVIAPHTSIFDFIIGWFGFMNLGIKPKIIIKKEFFWFPLGLLLKKLGAIPVDRSNSARFVKDIISEIRQNEQFVLAITPEGTRKHTAKWKRGAITIADSANIPIAIGYLDYKKKKGGIVDLIYTSDNPADDMIKIKSYYTDVSGKYPKNFTTGLK